MDEQADRERCDHQGTCPTPIEVLRWRLAQETARAEAAEAEVATARQEGAREALLNAAMAASWMEYPQSQDPRIWAKWLRDRAAALGTGEEGQQ